MVEDFYFFKLILKVVVLIKKKLILFLKEKRLKHYLFNLLEVKLLMIF